MTEEAIFAGALEERSPAGRAAYLDRACEGDSALRRRIEALLASHEQGGSFLEVPAVEQVAAADRSRFTGLEETQAETRIGEEGEPLDYLETSIKAGSLGRLGHYEVLAVVGRGGMGTVLRAFDEKLHRVVAIKVMAPELAATASARQRFTREARAAAAVCHEHVVTIHAVEEDHRPPFLVMQYVEGMSLQEKLDRKGALPTSEILRIGMQTASGLAAAHAQGLVHRDIKPANILLENGVERVKITDFGLARAADDASLTQSGVIAGTPLYMSPEQAEGAPIDHRSDLFSLGSVLYASCTGRAPFRAGTAVAVLKRVCLDDPRPIREINPDVPEWLCALITRLHAKDSADRPATAAEVADLLGRRLLLHQRPVTEGGETEVFPPFPTEREREGPPRAWKRPALAAAALLLATVAGLGLTDATGVTHVAGTVIRLFSPEGTLVVEVDDPGVSVAVDGSEVIITGAGAKEIRLKPGQYKVVASKGGKLIKQELVNVTREGRQVVRVSREVAKAPAPTIDLATDPAPQAALGRARAHAREGRWEAVEEDIDAAIGPAKAVTDWERTRPAFLALAGICLELGEGRRVGAIMDRIAARRPLDLSLQAQCWIAPLFHEDRDTCRRACDRLVRGFGATTNPWEGFLVAHALNMNRNPLMDADPLADRELAVKLAQLSVEGLPPEQLRAWGFVHKILAHAYSRAGRQVDALRELDRVDQADGWWGPASGDLLRAMILSRMGRAEEARRFLSRAQAWDHEHLTDEPSLKSALGEVDGWFQFKALLHQAEAVVEGTPTPTAAADWERSVAALPVPRQGEAVAARLRALNPGFKGRIEATGDDRTVERLDLIGDYPTDLSPLAALKGLKVLHCPKWLPDRGWLTDPDPSRRIDLAPLRGLPLKGLVFFWGTVDDLAPLRGTPLESLEIARLWRPDLSPLEGMPLKSLKICCRDLDGLSALKGTSLTLLDLTNCHRIGDDALAQLAALDLPLASLNLAYCPVKDLAPLKGKGAKLVVLNLDGTRVIDLEPLRGMPLNDLGIHNTGVTDMSPLAEMPLRSIAYQGTKLRDVSALRGMPLESVNCDFQPERDAEVLRAIPTLKRINGKPAADFWKEADARAKP